jgi:hypothetical protein
MNLTCTSSTHNRATEKKKKIIPKVEKLPTLEFSTESIVIAKLRKLTKSWNEQVCSRNMMFFSKGPKLGNTLNSLVIESNCLRPIDPSVDASE